MMGRRTTLLAVLLTSVANSGAFAFAPLWKRSSSLTTVRVEKPQIVKRAPSLKHNQHTRTSNNPVTTLSTPRLPHSTRLWFQNEDNSDETTRQQQQQQQQLIKKEEEKWESDSKLVELVMLGVWMACTSAFILVNNFVGPWPAFMISIPERTFFLCHMLGGMLFGGGIVLTTAIEWLVANNKNVAVLQFWFDKVPLLDTIIVLPALTVSMISGTGLSIKRYGGLSHVPTHVELIFWALIAFCVWWAATDLTTQGSALIAVNELTDLDENEIPNVVDHRHVSNLVSCAFVVMLYSIMVLKPGTLFQFP